MTTETAPDVAAIAERLTRAQRRVIQEGRLYYGRGYWPLYHALTAKGLVVTMFGHPLTELGLAAADHLRNGKEG